VTGEEVGRAEEELMRQGHCEQALEVVSAAVSEDAWFAPLHSTLAAIRIRRGEPKLALAHALEALDARRDVLHYRIQVPSRPMHRIRVPEGPIQVPDGPIHC
jgi:hypothetical protein